jgi:hypothetical protein
MQGWVQAAQADQVGIALTEAEQAVTGGEEGSTPAARQKFA